MSLKKRVEILEGYTIPAHRVAIRVPYGGPATGYTEVSVQELIGLLLDELGLKVVREHPSTRLEKKE